MNVKQASLLFALLASGCTISASPQYDTAPGYDPVVAERWSVALGPSSTLLRLGDDDRALLFGDGVSVRVVDAATGAVTSTIDAPQAGFAAFVPGARRALVVGHTTWSDKGPHTPVYD